jgi:hypothetical protein
VEGANLAYIVKVSGSSRTSIKDQIRERGLERSEGTKVLTGQVPYGWKLRNGQLVEHRGEQDAISIMAELRTEGKSLREICDALGAAGVRTKRGGSWKPTSVMKILKARSILTPHGN